MNCAISAVQKEALVTTRTPLDERSTTFRKIVRF